MEELNTTQSVDMIEEDGFDTVTLINLGASFVLSQVAEDGTLHNVVLGPEQLEKVTSWARQVLG